MYTPLSLELKDVRAVNSANIQLAGLTVLCGANSTGKSTIGRILQDALEVALYFKGVRRLQLLRNFIGDFVQPLASSVGPESEVTARKLFMPFFNLERRTSPTESDVRLESLLAQVRKLEESVKSFFNTESWRKVDVASRYADKLISALELGEDRNIARIEECLRAKFAELRDGMSRVETEVPTLDNIGMTMVSDYLWEGDVTLKEKGDVVWSYRNGLTNQFSSLVSVRRTFYIESPFASEFEVHGDRLDVRNNFMSQAIVKPGGRQTNDPVGNLMNEVLEGSVSYKLNDKSGNKGWFYERKDGENFPLSMSASGVRSISTIARLNGYSLLDENTVLILDEPEAHLHPAWVVAYARILVELVRRKKVRILLASHSPDMVHALKSFSLAAGIADCTRFYQAEQANGVTFKYDFVFRGLDIGTIFDSFNEVNTLISSMSDQMRSED